MSPLPNPLILVTGPTRSGKSEWAEHLALASGRSVTYLATAAVSGDDPEWQQRLERHRQRRCPTWTTVEGGANLVPVLNRAGAMDCLLIDALGTWLAHYLDQPEPQWQQTQTQLLQVLQTQAAMVIVVAEEVGWGLVPPYPLGRLFRDRLGSLSRAIGTIAQTVYLVTGGYVLNLTHLGTPLAIALDGKS